MFRRIQNFFLGTRCNHKMDLLNKPYVAHLGELSLKEMLQYSFSGKYIFHGSPAKLVPGKDFIMPGFHRHSDYCVYAGGIDIALRFALVRAYGIDQYGGTDFYVYCTQRYKLVIYDANSLGEDWFKQTVDKDTFVYAVLSDGIELDEVHSTDMPLRVAGRTKINPQELTDAGFLFVPDSDFSTERWWGIRNTDENITQYVLKAYPWLCKRQR